MLQIGQKYHRFLANGEQLKDVVISDENIKYYQDLEQSGVRFERVAGVVIHRKPFIECESCSA
jgi:hypothetical protein